MLQAAPYNLYPVHPSPLKALTEQNSDQSFVHVMSGRNGCLTGIYLTYPYSEYNQLQNALQ